MTDVLTRDDDALRERASRLSLEQKVRLLTGADFWSTYAEPAVGLKRMVLSDGPSGVRGEIWDERDPSLNLPSATALAATWDLRQAYRYGAALAAEAQRKGVHVVLGPTINLHRSPLGGRHFEAFSEDPLLTAQLAAAYVRGLQDHGVAATLKHYVANDAETDRFTADVIAEQRTLRELYLAAFETAVVEARAWAVMSAYNAVNGVTMTENPLLDEPLCGEWGFDGLVVSDWTAVRSTEPSARARQDLAMPGPDSPWGDALVAAVRAGRVPEAAIDDKIVRLLRLAARVGALDDVPPPAGLATRADGEDGVALARAICADGMVLVRNTGELPWTGAAPRSIALIGEHAAQPRTQGGGSATVLPDHVVSPLDGLRAALPEEATLTWTRGVPVQAGLEPLPRTALTDPLSGEPGARARFFDAAGREVLSERRLATNLVWLGTAPSAARRLELRTRFRPTDTGAVRLGLATVGHVRLAVDGRSLIDQDLSSGGTNLGAALFDPPRATARVDLVAGQDLDVLVEYVLPSHQVSRGVLALTLGTEREGVSVDEEIEAAVAAARSAEVAVVVVGTNAQVESEGFDRTSLALPGEQDRLVRAVAAANPRTVVIVNAGSPVTLPWRDDVAAILLGWFGGQEMGAALADVLLGRREPGGRLPTTWPAAEDDVPVLSTSPVDSSLRYDEGIHIGYRAWLRAGATPMYPFGYGLGYTTWDLSDLEAAVSDAGSVDVRVGVRNTGARRGKIVVQVYLSRADGGTSRVDRPRRWLAAFATATVDAGSRDVVRLTVPRRGFAHWTDGSWHVEPGAFTVHVGTSVVDLPLSAQVSVT